MNPIVPYVRLMRPHQWIKNGFVFVGVIFAHAWDDPELMLAAAALFASFCLVSSAVYAMNDIADLDADRLHPVKRSRPLARGDISPAGAMALCAALGIGGLALAAWVSTAALVIAGSYIVLNVAYSAGLKHVAVLDVFLIAGGFMLRILAGTQGLGIVPSKWLLFCGLTLTLFLGFSKRRAELADARSAPSREGARDTPVAQRPSLDGYSVASLDRMLAISAAATAIAYGFYTVAPDTILVHGTDRLVLTLPFVMWGLFRYLFVVYREGGGADPALELLRDRQLVAATAGWLIATLWILSG